MTAVKRRSDPKACVRALPATLEAFILDFDGTLATGSYDFPAMRERIHALASSYGVEAQALEGLYVLEAVERAAAMIQQAGGETGAFRAVAERIIREIELRGARSSQLLPGAGEALASLRESGYRIAIVTRNSRAVIETIAGAVSLARDAFLGRESVTRVKPHPEHLAAALACLECEGRHAAMVGDHPMDIAAGRAAGAATVGVLTGAGTRETLGAAGADLIVDSVIELAEALAVGRRRT